MQRTMTLLAALALAAGCASKGERGLRSTNEGVAREAVWGYAAIGTTALPELRRLAQDPDPVCRRHAKTAIGRITGQWGSEGRIVWDRSVEAAKTHGKPILVLQLFGKFDEEFC